MLGYASSNQWIEQPWLVGLFGASTVICIAVVYTKASTAYARRKLERFFLDRTPATALATCYAALPGVERSRVQQAYRWVQELVPYQEPPIQASDRLRSDLLVNRRGIELQLMSSAVWLNPAPPQAAPAPLHSIQTVAELMAEVLRRGYEAYPGRNAWA